MSATTTAKDALQSASKSKRSGLRRYALLRAHPVSLILDLVAGIWAVYFFWQHAWEVSLVLLVVERGVAWILLQAVDSNALADTLLGKLALLHLEPVNLGMQLAGLLLSLWGVWAHETMVILSGLSLVFLGHLAGWGAVHQALKWKG